MALEKFDYYYYYYYYNRCSISRVVKCRKWNRETSDPVISRGYVASRPTQPFIGWCRNYNLGYRGSSKSWDSSGPQPAAFCRFRTL